VLVQGAQSNGARSAAFDMWQRRLPRGGTQVLGGVARLVLFCLAAFVLVRAFSNLHFADLREGISATSGAQILK